MTADPWWYRSIVDRQADIVVTVDRDAVVTFVNPAAVRMFGSPAEELVGRSCLEFVHPDDVGRAVESLAYSHVADRPAEVPVRFQLRTRHGWRSFDVRGHGLGTDPAGETALIVARESDGLEELDAVLDALSAGATPTLVNTLVARHGVRDLWENQLAVVCWRTDGTVDLADTGLSDELRDLLRAHGPSPWSTARRTGVVEGGPAAELGPELGPATIAAGFGAVHALPVEDPLTSLDACIVSFGPEWLGVNLGYRLTLDRCARVLRLAEQQRHQREQLERIARSDPLTGIANRRRFLHRLDELLADHDAGTVAELTVVYADLDDFKPVNDLHGHAAGDAVLRVVATRLVEAAGPEGLAARLGGDEFAVVATRAPQAIVAAIRAAFATPVTLPTGAVCSVGLSLGAVRASVGDDSARLLDAADRECYTDKRSKERPTS